MAEEPDQPPPDDEFFKRQRRRRSIAIAIGLLVLVAMFYALTIIRLGGNVGVLHKPDQQTTQ